MMDTQMTHAEAISLLAEKEGELTELRDFKAACEGLITAAGEVMRKKAVHEANHFLRTDGLYIANAIRALPSVTLEDLQK
jgi:hypothetical protein